MTQLDTQAIARRARDQANRFAALAEVAAGRRDAAVMIDDPVAELAYSQALQLYRQWQAEARMTALAYGAPWPEPDEAV